MGLHLLSRALLFIAALLSVCLLRKATTQSAFSCKPEDFGAAGDGIRLDTEAVSRAVDACQAGGIVQFGPGKTYRLGEITITGRGIQVYVPASTVLLASAERAHYGPRQASWYLLHFYRCSGCTLTGGGVIQGPARAFVDNSTTPSTILNWRDHTCRVRLQCRPRLVGVCESSDVRVADVTLRDSAFWTLHIRDSDGVLVRGVTVRGDLDFPNNDGIDIDGSIHVTVLQSYIATADDALCIKATSGGRRAVRHVLVSNCTLTSRSAAVKLGSETRADMANLTFSHLQVLDSNRGLAIQLRDHGHIRDVAFAHVRLATRRFPGRWWGGGEPIYVTALPRWIGSRVGSITNISFTDIDADVAGAVVVFAGSPESLLRGVLLANVRMALAPLAASDSMAGKAAAAAAEPPPPGAVSVAVEALGRRRDEPGADGAAGGGAERRAAVQRGEGAAVVAAAQARLLRGGSAGGAAAGPLRMKVKLDLRPGPYGERTWLATAPVLAQFIQGLELRNVSFEVRAAGPEATGGEGAGKGAAATGSLAGGPSRESGPGVGQARQGRPARRPGRDGQEPVSGGQEAGGEWYQELVQQTVLVSAAEQMVMRVVPTVAASRTQQPWLDSRADARRPWAELSGAMRRWRLPSAILYLGRQAPWLCAATASMAVAAVVLLHVYRRQVQGQCNGPISKQA